MDRRLPIVFAVVYAAVLAVLAVMSLWTAFIVVAIICGPTTSLLFWLRARSDRRAATAGP